MIFFSIIISVDHFYLCFYNSKIISKSKLISDDFDPLFYAVQLGRSLGIEIHAWVNAYILWSSSSKPQDSNHIYLTKPDWLESNIYGKSDSNIDISKPQSHNWEGIYLSPNHPSVNQYLIEVVSELIELYNLDEDIFEINNLVSENIKVTRELSQKLTDYLIENNAQMPLLKEKGLQIDWPNSLLKN